MIRHRYNEQEQLQSEEWTSLYSLQAGQDEVRI